MALRFWKWFAWRKLEFRQFARAKSAGIAVCYEAAVAQMWPSKPPKRTGVITRPKKQTSLQARKNRLHCKPEKTDVIARSEGTDVIARSEGTDVIARSEETDVIARSEEADVIARPKKQTSLRGAKRRGNLYQVVIMQNEVARQRQEVATPSGLAMTSVFSGLQWCWCYPAA